MNGLRILNWRKGVGMTDDQKKNLDKILRKSERNQRRFKDRVNRENFQKHMDFIKDRLSPTGGKKPFRTDEN